MVADSPAAGGGALGGGGKQKLWGNRAKSPETDAAEGDVGGDGGCGMSS